MFGKLELLKLDVASVKRSQENSSNKITSVFLQSAMNFLKLNQHLLYIDENLETMSQALIVG